MGQALKKYTEEEYDVRHRLSSDYPYYAENVLKIRPKEGGLVPLKFNAMQLELHRIAEEQKARTGKVRIIIVKGRQGGCSTYIEGRGYHKITHEIGKKGFILTHLGEATNNLYSMVLRYYENTPKKVRPIAGTSNAKELIFNLLDSGYRVSTAGAKGTGRSDTIHFFHGSEVAFWENAAEHAAGVLQAAKNADEVFLESTANGPNNWFYDQWVKAVEGKSEYIPVFFAWFVTPEYRKPVPKGFKLTDDELEYKTLYNLDNEQMYWRRLTIEELGSEELFKQEYPANADEAFQFTGVDSYINTNIVMQALNRPLYASCSKMALVAGYDPSIKGVDRDAFIMRQGPNIFGLELPEFGDDEPARIRFCKNKLDSKIPYIDRLFIDAGGGVGIYSHLREDGYADRVRLVDFGKSADNKLKAGLKRDEMFIDFKEILTDKTLPAAIDINADYKKAFVQDLTATGFKEDAHGRPKMESKESIKKRLKRSTDIADACILTVAEPVKKEIMNTSYYQDDEEYENSCKAFFER